MDRHPESWPTVCLGSGVSEHECAYGKKMGQIRLTFTLPHVVAEQALDFLESDPIRRAEQRLCDFTSISHVDTR